MIIWHELDRVFDSIPSVFQVVVRRHSKSAFTCQCGQNHHSAMQKKNSGRVADVFVTCGNVLASHPDSLLAVNRSEGKRSSNALLSMPKHAANDVIILLFLCSSFEPQLCWRVFAWHSLDAQNSARSSRFEGKHTLKIIPVAVFRHLYKRSLLVCVTFHHISWLGIPRTGSMRPEHAKCNALTTDISAQAEPLSISAADTQRASSHVT